MQHRFERIERTSSSPLGRSSLVWTLRHDSADLQTISCRISLDAPFTGWHELTKCYESAGWEIVERRVQIDPDDPRHRWIESRFSRATGQHAVLVFGLMTQDGCPLAPPPGIDSARFIDRLLDMPTLQVQGFLESDGPVDDELLDELRTIVRTTAARTATLVRTHPGETSGG